MFSKDNNSEAPAAAPSFIGPDLTINGSVVTTGDVQLDGTLVGDMSGRQLTVGGTGKVEGELSAKTVRVSGEIVGELSADVIMLDKDARISGDMVHDSLEIQAGAQVEGRLRRRSGGSVKPVTSIKPVGKNGAADKSPNA